MCFFFLIQVNREGAGGTRVDGELTFLTRELDPDAEYIFEILAINGFGDGMLSVPVTIRTRFSGMLQLEL